MRLRDLTPALLRRTLQIYLDQAYGPVSSGGAKTARAVEQQVRDGLLAPELLKLFHDDTRRERNSITQRFTLRLGNRNYPFMKLVLQEHLVADEFVFAVDTHDDIKIKPNFPEYEAWMAVCRFNCDLKARIETDWAAAGIPTFAEVRKMVLARVAQPACQRGQRILVVDDEKDIADTVASLLTARGFTVSKVHDGVSGVREAIATHPDLILLDYEMPELDGIQVIETLRNREDTRRIPILLATAAACEWGEIRKANGFLTKPFQEDTLYLVVENLLARGPE